MSDDPEPIRRERPQDMRLPFILLSLMIAGLVLGAIASSLLGHERGSLAFSLLMFGGFMLGFMAYIVWVRKFNKPAGRP